MNDTEKAVSFAASMVRKGQYIGEAITIASRYYKVDRSDVQKGMASRSGKSQKGKPKPRAAAPNQCSQCAEPPVWKMINHHGMAARTVYYACEQHKHDAAYGFGDDDITKTEYKALKPAAKQPQQQ